MNDKNMKLIGPLFGLIILMLPHKYSVKNTVSHTAISRIMLIGGRGWCQPRHDWIINYRFEVAFP